MDNNKIVDNLNFIKIYFRVFIYKIIVLKKPEQRMKTRLGTRTGQKTLEEESKRHPNAFRVQEPIRHFWSAERHSKRAEFPLCGLWPNGLLVTMRHTLFDLFTKGCVQIQTLIICTYFLESSSLYK